MTGTAGYRSVLALALVTIMGVAGAANAQDNDKLNINSFRPSPHFGDILGVRTNTMGKQWDWSVGAWMTYQYRPLLLDVTQFNQSLDVIKHEATVDLFGNVAVLDWLEIGLALPISVYSKGDSGVVTINSTTSFTAFDQVDGTSLGDLRLALKARVIGGNGKGFGFGFSQEISFPTSTGDNYNGDSMVSGTTLAVADFSMKGWAVALNAGVRLRQTATVFQYDVDHQIVWGFGVSAPAVCGVLDIFVTTEGHTSLTTPFSSMYDNYVDVMGGLKYRAGNGFTLIAAGGRGFMSGFGSPVARGTMSLSYSPSLERGCVSDRDKDGVCDADDRCPDVPGLVDADGCPDRDGDGLVDTEDSCPDLAGPVAQRGCPDSDMDGIHDGIDACPTAMGSPENDGCPDRDGDGIRDSLDKCPEERGDVEHNGCPPPKVEVVIKEEPVTGVKTEKIEIERMVLFGYDSAEISPRFSETLKEIAKLLKDNQSIQKVRIEGYTDDRGTAEYNMDLSRKRAKAVYRFLLRQGVDAGRLEWEGYGMSRPLVSGDTDDARSQNRRVEFNILQRKQ